MRCPLVAPYEAPILHFQRTGGWVQRYARKRVAMFGRGRSQFHARLLCATLTVAFALGGCATGGREGNKSSSDPVTERDSNDTVSPPIDAGTDVSNTDASVSDESDADVPDTAVPLVDCSVSNECVASGRYIGEVAGDGTPTDLEVNGHGGEWLSVFVTDTGNHFVNDSTLGARFELISYGGADYDLTVFRAGSSMTPARLECSDNATVAQDPSNQIEVIEMRWADVTNGLGASDGDGRRMGILIEHVGGDCTETSGWELRVRGNP